MHEKEIILLNGLPRSGKDTFADYMVEHHGYKKLSFASALKTIISKTFNISMELLDDLKNNDGMIYEGNDKFQISMRDILRRFGTEGMKPFFGEDIWARLVYNEILKSSHNKFIIADFRFLSEFIPGDYKLKTILIKDERELPLQGHSSDVELYQNDFNFDMIVDNTSTLDNYYCNIENLDIF